MHPKFIEIAKKAQVSVATVSRFYKDRNSVSLKTREKIERTLKGLGVTPRTWKKEALTIALIVPDVENPFFASLVKNVEFFLSRLGCFFLLCNASTFAIEENYFAFLEKRGVDGIILVPSGRWDGSRIERVNSIPFPIVVLDRKIEGLQVPFVLCDNEEGGKIATEYLLRLGRRKIAFISGKRETSTSLGRLAGYQKALEENNVGFLKELIFEGDFSFQSGMEAAKHILDAGIKVDAIFSANDFMALGVMEVLKKKGVRIPTDISVIGYDDTWLSRICEPALTTVRQPVLEMCGAAVDILFHLIQYGDLKHSQEIILKPELVVRESCVGFTERG